ncbi:MAG: helix-turn-helix transcriptional regulator [Dehalococcoidia bacterium]|nr:helix-turn-helix transcriptional regulator [Dehalococcoidia bacterium]
MTRRGRGRPPHPDILTPAEWRVLEELRTGGTYAEIAVRLGVSPDAVRFHVRNMRAKLNLRDRAELVAWTPPDGERRRSFRALPAPLASLPFATRTIVGVAAAAVVAGAVVAAIMLVVALGSREGTPPAVAVPEESAMTPTPTDTPPATASPAPEAAPVATPETSPTPAPPGATPTSATPTGVASSDCTFDFRDVFHLWVDKPEYEGVPMPSSTPSPRWIGQSPWVGGDLDSGIRLHDLIAVGSVRDVERVENVSDGRTYLLLVIEVEDVLWGAIAEGTVLRVLVDGSSREILDWEAVEAARQSLLCSRALLANPRPVHLDDELVGRASGELHEVSPWDIAIGPGADPFIDDLAEAFRRAAAEAQPRTCPLFSPGTGTDVGVARFLGPYGGTVSGLEEAVSAGAAVVEGNLVSVVGEALVVDHVSQGPLAERYLVVEVEVRESLGGAVRDGPGTRLRLVLPVSASVTPEHVASLLPCEGALLLVSRFAADWLRVSLSNDGGSLYTLYDQGLYLETKGGHLLNPYVSWAWADWYLYGPMTIYGVNVQYADLGEFSGALRAALANR